MMVGPCARHTKCFTITTTCVNCLNLTGHRIRSEGRFLRETLTLALQRSARATTREYTLEETRMEPDGMDPWKRPASSSCSSGFQVACESSRAYFLTGLGRILPTNHSTLSSFLLLLHPKCSITQSIRPVRQAALPPPPPPPLLLPPSAMYVWVT